MKTGRWVALGAVLIGVGFLAGWLSGVASIDGPLLRGARDVDAMETAVRDALAEPRAFARADALVHVLAGLTPENAPGALHAIEARASHHDPVDLQLFLTAWTQVDAPAAMQAVTSWRSRARRELGVRIVMREWAATGSPLAATTFFETISSPELREVAAGPLVRGWALAGDVDGALALARRLWDREDRIDVTEGLVRGIVHVRGPEETFEFVAEVVARDSAGGFERRLAEVALKVVAAEDPAAAGALYSRLSRESEATWLSGSLPRIAGAWGEFDPGATLEWLIERGPSAERHAALSETMRRWALDDFEGAWGWLAERTTRAEEAEASPTPGLDEGVESLLRATLVWRLAQLRPDEAAEWVERVDDASQRRRLVYRVAYFWAAGDPEAARDWVAGLDLAPAERAGARRAIARGGPDASEPDSE